MFRNIPSIPPPSCCQVLTFIDCIELKPHFTFCLFDWDNLDRMQFGNSLSNCSPYMSVSNCLISTKLTLGKINFEQKLFDKTILVKVIHYKIKEYFNSTDKVPSPRIPALEVARLMISISVKFLSSVVRKTLFALVVQKQVSKTFEAYLWSVPVTLGLMSSSVVPQRYTLDWPPWANNSL